jgi:hypothetical protein
MLIKVAFMTYDVATNVSYPPTLVVTQNLQDHLHGSMRNRVGHIKIHAWCSYGGRNGNN